MKHHAQEDVRIRVYCACAENSDIDFGTLNRPGNLADTPLHSIFPRLHLHWSVQNRCYIWKGVNLREYPGPTTRVQIGSKFTHLKPSKISFFESKLTLKIHKRIHWRYEHLVVAVFLFAIGY